MPTEKDGAQGREQHHLTLAGGQPPVPPNRDGSTAAL